MESLVAQFELLASSADEKTRISLLNFAQQMQYALERPADMIQRIGCGVCHSKPTSPYYLNTNLG